MPLFLPLTLFHESCRNILFITFWYSHSQSPHHHLPTATWWTFLPSIVHIPCPKSNFSFPPVLTSLLTFLLMISSPFQKVKLETWVIFNFSSLTTLKLLNFTLYLFKFLTSFNTTPSLNQTVINTHPYYKKSL